MNTSASMILQCRLTQDKCNSAVERRFIDFKQRSISELQLWTEGTLTREMIYCNKNIQIRTSHCLQELVLGMDPDLTTVARWRPTFMGKKMFSQSCLRWRRTSISGSGKNGAWAQQIDWCSFYSIVYFVPVHCGEDGTELQGEALH